MSTFRGVDPDLAKALREEASGERILWAGQPSAAWAFLQTLPILLFAVPWTAFSGFMMSVVVGAALFGEPQGENLGPWEFAGGSVAILFLTPFVLIGLAMMSAPVVCWWIARRTVHAVTDERILTLTETRTRKVVSILPQHIISLERREHRDGSGTLKIVTGYKKDGDGDTVSNTQDIGHVPGIRSMEDSVNRLRERIAA